MKIEIDIEAELGELWRKIGLDRSAVEVEYDGLVQRVQDVFHQFLAEVVNRARKLEEEADAAEKAVRSHIEKFALGEVVKIDATAPLMVRISTARECLKDLEDETDQQNEEFVSLYADLMMCFEALRIEDRGEFAEEGVDFSWDRIERMANLTSELNDQIMERKPRMEELVDEVNDLRKLLGMQDDDHRQLGGSLSDTDFIEVERERDELREKLQSNRIEIEGLAKTIRRTECVLQIKSTLPKRQTVFSDGEIQRLQVLLEHLEEEKENHIPEFVDAMKKRLLELWSDLHILVPSALEFPFMYDDWPTKRTLVALESEVLRLENTMEQVAPILDLIASREEILELNNNLPTGSDRLTSRRGRAASQLLEQERGRRRYSIELPKIHTKLIRLLKQYENTYGEHFTWNGKNLIDVIREARGKERTSPAQTKTRNVNRQLTPQRKVGTALSPRRVPFQLQEFML